MSLALASVVAGQVGAEMDRKWPGLLVHAFFVDENERCRELAG